MRKSKASCLQRQLCVVCFLVWGKPMQRQPTRDANTVVYRANALLAARDERAGPGLLPYV